MNLVTVVAALALLAACGDDGGFSPDAAPADAALLDGAVDAYQPPNRGDVTLTSYDGRTPSGDQTTGGTASASFFAPGATCTDVITGPCRVSTCTQPLPVNAQSAGMISVTGGLSPVELTPDGESLYATANPGKFFGGGMPLVVSAPGASVPAFSSTIASPTPSTLTAPDTGAGFSIDRTEGVTLQWNPSGGSLVFSMSRSGADPIVCTFASSAGVGTIPPAAIAGFPTGIASYSITNEETTETVIADWLITVRAIHSSVWVGTRIASGAVSIE